jgi:hypothetical protein
MASNSTVEEIDFICIAPVPRWEAAGVIIIKSQALLVDLIT